MKPACTGLATLRAFRIELADAEREGFEFVAERARDEIRKSQNMIRRHCKAMRVAVPHEEKEISA